jgi:subtilisin family serine protease
MEVIDLSIKRKFLAIALIIALVVTVAPVSLTVAATAVNDKDPAVDVAKATPQTDVGIMPEPAKVSYSKNGNGVKANYTNVNSAKGGQTASSEIVVKFKKGTSDTNISGIMSQFKLTARKQIPKIGYRVFKTDGKMGFKALAKEIRKQGRVESVEPVHIMKAQATPNDPYFSSSGTWGQDYQDMWGLYNVKADAAWDTQTGSTDVVVAVSDTGLDLTHPDMQGNIWNNADEIPGNGIDDDNNGYVDDVNGWNFIANTNNPTDDHGHGTHVSGTISATTNNGLGVAGICWNAKIMPVKFLDEGGYGSDADGASTIIYAADNGAKVINCSWGGNGSPQVLNDAIAYATGKGVTVVCAAGNLDVDAGSFWPGGNDNVLTVGATDNNDEKALFSNFGNAVEVSAPGVDILSLKAANTNLGDNNVGDDYLRLSGTSMAAPHVSGLAALLSSQHPSWTSNQIIAQIVGTTDSLSRSDMGTGRINAQAALTGTPSTCMQVLDYKSDDSIGNADGVIDAGESFNMIVKVRNLAAPVTGVTATLTSNDPYVTITRGTVDFGDMPGWTTGENSSMPFIVSMSTDTPKVHKATFTLTVSANDGNYSTTKSMWENVATFLPGWPVNIGPGADNSVALADMDKDGQNEVINVTDKVYVLNSDGTAVPGWPKEWPTVPYYEGFYPSSPIAGDLDNDGNMEIALVAGAYLHAWRADGTTMPGFPIRMETISELNAGDIDKDGDLELFVADDLQGIVYAYHHDGSTVAGWPVAQSPLADGWALVGMNRAIGDIDGDGYPEIVAPMMNNKLYGWNHDGTLCAGWPVTAINNGSLSPALGDIDNDGKDEVFIDSNGDGMIYGFYGDGTSIAGWPQYGSAPSLGDIDSDGELEVLCMAGGDIYVYKLDGQMATGWPKPVGGTTYSEAQLADVDGDSQPEIFVRSGQDVFYGWNGDGTLLNGFPLSLMPEGDTVLWTNNGSGVAIGDINNDGLADMITGPVGLREDKIFAVGLPGPYNVENSPWPMHKVNALHSGAIPPFGSNIDTQPPTEPVLSAVQTAATQVSLSWTAATDDSGVVHYSVFRDDVLLGATDALSYADTSAQGSAYTYRVEAVDPSGNRGVSNNVTVTLDHTAPISSASPKGGSYRNTQTVSLSANEKSAIYYTVDGSTPTEASLRYLDTPITIVANTTLKFIAVDLVGNKSSVYTEVYTIDNTAPTVTATPKAGYYNKSFTVSLSANEPATIYYTTNGTTPTTSSTKYTTPISITKTTTLKFFGVDMLGNKSAVSTVVYTFDIIAPGAPGLYSVTGINPGIGLKLNWTAATDNFGGSGIASYDVFRSTSIYGTYIKINSSPLPATQLTYTDTSITAGKTYYYYIKATDKAGNTGSASSKKTGRDS